MRRRRLGCARIAPPCRVMVQRCAWPYQWRSHGLAWRAEDREWAVAGTASQRSERSERTAEAVGGPARVSGPALREGTTAWEAALSQRESAADLLGLDQGMRDLLATPKRELTVAVPVRRDDGHVEVFSGYRVHHNVTRGPAKGGSAITRRCPSGR